MNWAKICCDLFLQNPNYNTLPKNKSLDLSKLKAFAGDKKNAIHMTSSVFDREENIVGKGKNVGYQNFLLFPGCFQQALSTRSVKVGILW